MEKQIEKPKSGGFFSYLKTQYFNLTYLAKSTSTEELATMVAKDQKGNYLVNPKIILLQSRFPLKAQNWKELVIEI